MSEKTSVVLSDSLVAEARRLAGARTSAAAVNAALREYVRARNGEAGAEKPARKADDAAKKSGGRKSGAKPGTWEGLAELAKVMREGDWDDTGYRLLRGGKRLDIG